MLLLSGCLVVRQFAVVRGEAVLGAGRKCMPAAAVVAAVVAAVKVVVAGTGTNWLLRWGLDEPAAGTGFAAAAGVESEPAEAEQKKQTPLDSDAVAQHAPYLPLLGRRVTTD